MGCFGFSFGKERNTQDSTHAGHTNIVNNDILFNMYVYYIGSGYGV
jgi:hypothetical protein